MERQQVYTHLCILMSIMFFVIIMPPTSGLTFRITQRTRVLILNPPMEDPFRPTQFGLRTLITGPHTPIRCITWAVVTKRSIQYEGLFKRGNRGWWHHCHGGRWLGSDCWCMYGWTVKVRERESSWSCGRHINVAKVSVFVLRRVQKVRGWYDDFCSVLAFSSSRFEGFHPSEQGFGTVSQTFGSRAAETCACFLFIFFVAW